MHKSHMKYAESYEENTANFIFLGSNSIIFIKVPLEEIESLMGRWREIKLRLVLQGKSA